MSLPICWKRWHVTQHQRKYALMIFSTRVTFEKWHQILSHTIFVHYNDVIMGAIASQITSLTIVYSTVYSNADQRKHLSSASLAFVKGIHRGPVNSPHKWPVTRKMFPFDDVITSRIWFDVWRQPMGEGSWHGWCLHLPHWTRSATMRAYLGAILQKIYKLKIQIMANIFSLYLIKIIKLSHNFAHATSVLMSWHVQNYDLTRRVFVTHKHHVFSQDHWGCHQNFEKRVAGVSSMQFWF